MKLTKPQAKALQIIANSGPGPQRVAFRTGEALRARGLADRYTMHIIKAEYVTKDSSTDQGWASRRQPAQQHEWYITLDGYAVLQQNGGTA